MGNCLSSRRSSEKYPSSSKVLSYSLKCLVSCKSCQNGVDTYKSDSCTIASSIHNDFAMLFCLADALSTSQIEMMSRAPCIHTASRCTDAVAVHNAAARPQSILIWTVYEPSSISILMQIQPPKRRTSTSQVNQSAKQNGHSVQQPTPVVKKAENRPPQNDE